MSSWSIDVAEGLSTVEGWGRRMARRGLAVLGVVVLGGVPVLGPLPAAAETVRSDQLPGADVGNLRPPSIDPPVDVVPDGDVPPAVPGTGPGQDPAPGPAAPAAPDGQGGPVDDAPAAEPAPVAVPPESVPTTPPAPPGALPEPVAGSAGDAGDEGGPADTDEGVDDEDGQTPVAVAPDPARQVGDYLAVVPLTFPTLPEASFVDSYHFPRDGGRRVHKAADLMGEKLWPLFAAVDGVVCRVGGADGHEPPWGYSLTVCGDDGRRYRYLHLNNDTPGTDDGAGGAGWAFAPGIREGVRVRAGQHVGYMGDSGNAEGTPPHLHFDVFDDAVRDVYGDHRLNPYPSLVHALRHGRVVTTAADVPAVLAVASDAVRIAGDDRVGTALALTEEVTTTPSIVLASADRHEDALVGAVLAARLDVPLLLSWPDRLDPRVADRIGALRPDTVMLVGGAATPELVTAVEMLGPGVLRMVDDDPVGTAVLAAERIWQLSPPGRREAVLVTSGRWEDSLLAAHLAVARGAPILFAGPEGVASATAAALREVDRLAVVGAVTGPVPLPPEAVQHLVGVDHLETAATVLQAILAEQPVGSVWLVTADNWPDAVLAAHPAADEGGVVVPVDRDGGGAAALLVAEAVRGRVGGVRVVLVGGRVVLLPGLPDLPLAVLPEPHPVVRRSRRGNR